MPKRPNPKDDQSVPEAGLLLLVFAILLFAGGLFLSNQPGIKNHGTRDQSSKHDPTESLIDDQLKDADTRQRIRQEQTVIENQNMPGTADDERTHDDKVNPLVFDQENSGAKVIESLESKKRKPSANTPDSRIMKKLERDEWARDYEQRYQDEYVRQFLENARENGVEVKLNENLDVTGVKRIPVERPIRVPQSESGGSK